MKLDDVEGAFEAILNMADDQFLIAVHDMTHAILSDRGRGGVKPPPRRMKDAVRTIREEMARKGWQPEWNKIRDEMLKG